MKTVLITGVSKGLGKSLFDQFASLNYNTIGISRTPQAINANKHNTLIIEGDITEENISSKIQASIGKIPVDLIINNAGIGGTSFQLQNTSIQEITNLFNTHCLGCLTICQAMEANLLAAPKPLVININSRLGSIHEQAKGTFSNLEVSYAYRIAKAAQNMLTCCLRNEFKGRIQFVAVNPGKMKTQISQTDANTTPEDAAANIINHYQKGYFKEENGIIDFESNLLNW